MSYRKLLPEQIQKKLNVIKISENAWTSHFMTTNFWNIKQNYSRKKIYCDDSGKFFNIQEIVSITEPLLHMDFVNSILDNPFFTIHERRLKDSMFG